MSKAFIFGEVVGFVKSCRKCHKLHQATAMHCHACGGRLQRLIQYRWF